MLPLTHDHGQRQHFYLAFEGAENDMDVMEALVTRRSIRKYWDKSLPNGVLEELLEVARFYPSGLNLQPLKFMPVAEGEDVTFVTENLRWAGYLPDYEIGIDERPVSYILVFGDRQIGNQFEFAAGSAVNQLLLGIHGKGLGGCCLAIHKKAQILEHFQLDAERFEPLYAIAIGYAKHGATTADLTTDCKYTLDENGDFIVPKRTVSELTIKK